jgi:hypothetical protein
MRIGRELRGKNGRSFNATVLFVVEVRRSLRIPISVFVSSTKALANGKAQKPMIHDIQIVNTHFGQKCSLGFQDLGLSVRKAGIKAHVIELTMRTMCI